MRQSSLLTCLSISLLGLTSTLFAQVQKLPADLAGLPDEIKNLKWQSIDVASLTPLEQSRALLLLDHVLGEVSANATSEADLMSAYIEKQNLGAQFASTPPPPAPKQLSYNDALKVAVALLRGPMSTSYYATELGDASPGQLQAYAQMYQRTEARKWSEFDEARHQLLCMSSFLGNAQKMQDYDTWATAESARRQKAYEQQAAASGAAQPAAAQNPALQQQNAQLNQALGAAEYQQQAQSQQVSQAQQQTADAQQQTANAQQQTANAQQQTSSSAVPVTGYYGGYGAYGAYGATGTAAAAGAYAGANAANAEQEQQRKDAAAGAAVANNNNQNHAAGNSQYHASNSTWNKNASYNSSAHADTEQRMSSFHGTSGGGRGGRR